MVSMQTVGLLLAATLPMIGQDVTQPPANARRAYTVQGVGVQIYRCAQTDSHYSWTLQEPQAELVDVGSHTVVGTHGKGPTWTWRDGSAVIGMLLRQKPAPDATNIPWLLVKTTSTGTPGALENVSFVRRSDTQGGIAPGDGCSEGTAKTLARIPYRATYTFYTVK